MNYTKAIVDFGIPFFIIVGAGLATFTLTGGVNEYPDPKVHLLPVDFSFIITFLHRRTKPMNLYQII